MAHLNKFDLLLLGVAELITSIRVVFGEGGGLVLWLDAPGACNLNKEASGG